ncbi:MAG TPA: hypothetical protein VF168_13455 [Trueperaceae bacterium]
MNDPKRELLQLIDGYESATKLLPSVGPDAASYFSALRPAIESTLGCVKRLVNAVKVQSRSEQERFRQVVSQARSYLQQALADMYQHASVSVYELLRGIKHLLQDLIHNRLVDEERILSFDRTDLKAILEHLKFPPRKGSRLRAVLEAA